MEWLFHQPKHKEYTVKKACKKSTSALAVACVATSLLLAGTGCVSKYGAPFHWDNSVKPSKVGSASRGLVLGFIKTGDATINAAMRDGRIEKIHHVDYSDMTLFGGLYWQQTIKVYGE